MFGLGSKPIVRNGGARLSGTAQLPQPLSNGPEWSWLPHVLPGDDQGQSGACQTFALASWAEVMHGINVTDRITLNAYQVGLDKYHRKWGDGMTVPEAVSVANESGWFWDRMKARSESGLDKIYAQPLIAVYEVTPAWDLVSFEGCLKHDAPDTPKRGYHAVLIVARGFLPQFGPEELVYIENSWSDWGWRGLGVMRASLHAKLCCEIWSLEAE